VRCSYRCRSHGCSARAAAGPGRWLHTLQRAFASAGGKWSTFVIWAKNTFTLGRADYQRQYEPILYGWKEGSDHYWCGARDQADVWFLDKPG
jgi:DNA modification methylase